MELHWAAICGVLLATLAVTSFGAPVERSIWNHSCGHAVRTEENIRKIGVRHGVAKMITVVKDQIGVAITCFKNEKKSINDYYGGVTKWDKGSYKYDWLPKKQRAWYKDNICSLSKNIRVKKGFQAFNSSLHIFSATFEELKKFSPDTNATIRYKILDTIHTELKQLLCEVEWTLMSLNETTPQGEGENILSKRKHWNKNPDETHLLVQDWGVISFFEAYLTDWKVIVNKLNRANGCGNKKRKSNSQKTKGKNHAP